MQQIRQRFDLTIWTRNLVLFAVALFLARFGQGLLGGARMNFFIETLGLSGGQVLWLEGIRELPGLPDWTGATLGWYLIAKDEQLNILEVETANSLSDRTRGERWAAFARHAGQQKGKFWLVVPKGLRLPTAA